MRKDTLEFAKKKYFNGHSNTHSVQENISHRKLEVGLFNSVDYTWDKTEDSLEK